MIRRLVTIRGWATLGVVCNHASSLVFIGMFWWTHRYRSVTVPNYDQYGSLGFWAVTAISQLVLFSVPAFLFISGVFVAYAAQGKPLTLGSKVMHARLLALLWPFLIWTFVTVAGQWTIRLAAPSVSDLELAPFAFFPLLLAQYYLLSPWLVQWARHNPVPVLAIAAVLQLTVVAARYVVLSGASSIAAATVAETPLWLFTRWALYFPLGVVVGQRLKQVSLLLRRCRWWLTGATVVLGICMILETDLIYRWTDNWNWAYESTKISVNLYAVLFIFSYLAFDAKRGRLAQGIGKLGQASYIVYLLHAPVLQISAKAVYHIIPGIVAWPIMFQMALVGTAVGVPYLIMVLVARSPWRRLAPYLFG